MLDLLSKLRTKFGPLEEWRSTPRRLPPPPPPRSIKPPLGEGDQTTPLFKWKTEGCPYRMSLCFGEPPKMRERYVFEWIHLDLGLNCKVTFSMPKAKAIRLFKSTHPLVTEFWINGVKYNE